MSGASFRVLMAGPLVSFQDGGRTGQMRYGVPASGPMDRVSFSAANIAIGKPANATAIEISAGGLQMECVSGETYLAINGGDFIVELDGEAMQSGIALSICAGQSLFIRPGPSGNWCYLSFAGELQNIPQWVGSSATHSLSGLGGGNIKKDMVLNLSDEPTSASRIGAINSFNYNPFDGYVRVVLGPQNQYFSDNSLKEFAQSEFTLTTKYNRMGVRLDGPVLELIDALSIHSEPLVKGSIQISGDGIATVLMSDHQTTGGYPKIATIVSADHDNFSQLRPREKLRFKIVSPEDAVKLARLRAVELKYYFDTLT